MCKKQSSLRIKEERNNLNFKLWGSGELGQLEENAYTLSLNIQKAGSLTSKVKGLVEIKGSESCRYNGAIATTGWSAKL